MDAVPNYKEEPELRRHFLDGVIIIGRTLGVGAFGTVVEIQIDGTMYAGKTIHSALLNAGVQGTRNIVDKFVTECRLMSEVKHPNIIQFMGLCILKRSKHPTIVMERLDMSLDNLLETRKDLTLTLKLRILLDVSRGLVYLHGRIPPIIHRDLTSRNVLIYCASMQAKIADLGNALLTEQGTLIKTLSQMPGTPVYMPPEAVGTNPKYDTSLDMFSYGQLSLYVATGVFPGELLPATYTDPVTEKVLANSELERRRQYIDMLQLFYGEDHPLLTIVKGCLHNMPSKRPTANVVRERITALLDNDQTGEDYLAVRDASAGNHAHGATASENVVKTHLRVRIQQLKRGAAGVLKIYKSTGTVRKKWGWKQYVFKMFLGTGNQLNDMSFVKYFRSDKEDKAVGGIKLSKIFRISTTDHRQTVGSPQRFGFQIEFFGKGNPDSPWLLSADTKEECLSWMEALQPGSTLVLADDIYDLPYDVPTRPLYEEIDDVLPVRELDVAVPPLPPPRPLPRPRSRGSGHSQQPQNTDTRALAIGQPRANALDTYQPPPPQDTLPTSDDDVDLYESLPPQDTLPTSDDDVDLYESLPPQDTLPTSADDVEEYEPLRLQDTLPTSDDDVEEYERLLLGDVVNDSYMDLQLLQEEYIEVGTYQGHKLRATSSSPELRHNAIQAKPSKVTSGSSSPTPIRPSSESNDVDTSLLATASSTPLDISSVKEVAHLDPAEMQLQVLIQMQQMLQMLQESYQMVIPGSSPSALSQSSFVPQSTKAEEDASIVGSSLRRRVEALESSLAAPPVPPRTDSSPLHSSAKATTTSTKVPQVYDEVALSSSEDDESEYIRRREGIYDDISTIDFSKVVLESKRDKERLGLNNEPSPKLIQPSETVSNSGKPSIPPKPRILRNRPASLSNGLRKPPLPSPRSGSLRDKARERESIPKDKLVPVNLTPPTTASSVHYSNVVTPEEREAPRAGPPERNPQTPSCSPRKGGAQPIAVPRFNRCSKRDAADMMRKVLGNLLDETKDMTSDSMLVTEEDEGDSYVMRPGWAKANTLSKPITYDPLATLRQEALFIARSSLQIQDTIGQGQFGKIYKALLTRGSAPAMQVAVKTIKKYQSKKETTDFFKEMHVMSQLIHPNILRLYGIVQQDSPWIVLELLPHGDLKAFLMRNYRPVEKLLKYMLDVSVGMHYIAEKGLVHRDLAARNVIVGENEICKVADFGLLRELPKDNSIYIATSNTPCPIRWMAPESLLKRAFSTASDVWSFGVLLWELSNPTAEMPYEEFEDNQQCAAQVVSGYTLSIPDVYPHTVQRIMKSCWHHNPEKRPSFMLTSTLLTNMAFRP